MTSNLVIYHNNCVDGFGAAWAVKDYLQNLKDPNEILNWHFTGATYGDEPEDVSKYDTVYLVDFSYKADVLQNYVDQGKEVIVLDHHKTAQADLEKLLDGGVIGGVFDMDRSGAMITWDYFQPGIDPPKLLEYIQDRDLWRFELPDSKEVSAALFSYPYDFTLWDDLMDDDCIPNLINEGQAILRKQNKDINELIEANMFWDNVGGNRAPILNVPYTLASDSCHRMLELHPEAAIAATYYVNREGNNYSLRSRENGPDVSAIAKTYGGGGHEHAAGFRLAKGESL